MPSNFDVGESDAAGAGAPGVETMGARYGISETIAVPAGRGAHEAIREPYLMPSVHYVNGNMETTVPGIQLTPLGAEMPSMGIAPAVPAGNVGAFPTSDHGEFGQGVEDAYPEGCPVPLR